MGLGVEGGWYGLLFCSHSLRFVGGSGLGMVVGIIGGKEGGKIVELRCLMHFW